MSELPRRRRQPQPVETEDNECVLEQNTHVDTTSRSEWENTEFEKREEAFGELSKGQKSSNGSPVQKRKSNNERTPCPLWVWGIACITAILYLFANMYDASVYWMNILLWLDSDLYALLTLGWWNGWTTEAPYALCCFATTFSGVLFAAFPMAALVFKQHRKKILSIVLAVCGLLLSLLGINGTTRVHVIADGLLLLQTLLCIGVCLFCVNGKGGKVYSIICFAAAIASLVISTYLLNYRINIFNGKVAPYTGNSQPFASYKALDHSTVNRGIYFWPYSRTAWFVLLGIGFMMNLLRRRKTERRKNNGRINNNNNHSLLEQYKREHGM